MSLSVDIPDEPDDRAVVLDRDANAWQRWGNEWVRVRGVVPLWGPSSAVKPWEYLLVDRGPLTPLITEAECATSLDEFLSDAPVDLDALPGGTPDPDDLRAPSIPEVVTRRTRAFPAGDEG